MDASCLVDSVWMLFDDNYSDDSGESTDSVRGLVLGTVALLRRITAYTYMVEEAFGVTGSLVADEFKANIIQNSASY